MTGRLCLNFYYRLFLWGFYEEESFVCLRVAVPTVTVAQEVREKLPEYCIPHIAQYVSEDKVDCPPKKAETPRLSLCTYNFTAITPPYEPEDYARKLPYMANLPGLLLDDRLRDQCGKRYVIPAFKTKEAGVGAWWYWMRKRTNRTAPTWGYAPDAKVSLAMLSEDICGCRIFADGQIPRGLKNYRDGYPKFAKFFWGRAVSLEELLDLSDPEDRWAIAQTMFSHEAGRPIDDSNLTRAQFEVGISLAEDHIDGLSIDLKDYFAPQN